MGDESVRGPGGHPAEADLDALEERLGHRFRDRTLLEQALTHRSWTHERGGGRDFERLELLGDAALGLITVDWLLERRPGAPVGDLAELKSYLVSEQVLARAAEKLDLGSLVRLGVGEARSGGARKPALQADLLEALLGALYLEGGMAPVRGVIEPMLEEAADEHDDERHRQGAKTRLQELAQARGWPLPEYRLIEQSGPDHDRRYTFGCWVRSEMAGVGSGPTKKAAQLEAAAAALARLEDEIG